MLESAWCRNCILCHYTYLIFIYNVTKIRQIAVITEKSQLKICNYRNKAVPLHPISEKSLKKDRDLAQLVAHTSGGREVAGSSPVIPTEVKSLRISRFSGSFLLFRSKRLGGG